MNRLLSLTATAGNCFRLLPSPSFRRLLSTPVHPPNANAAVTAKIMDVAIVPCLRENYAYLLIDRASNLAAAIDPVEPEKVLAEAARRNLQLAFILTTHHHSDHAGGNSALLASLPAAIPVYAGDPRVQAISHTLADGDSLTLGSSITIRAMHTPCHTTGHISYYCTSSEGATDTPVVFTGDTLFLGGCGRFFEGTADQMLGSLDKLAALPQETKVYCGHEYTEANLKFGVTVDATNDRLRERLAKLGAVTVPGTIEEELATNVFMRTRVKDVGQAVGGQSDDPVKVMAALREAKNEFRG